MKLNERNDIGQLLMLATRDFHRRLAGQIKAMNMPAISAAQGAVMTHIVNHGPSRMVDIAESNGVKSQSLLKVVNELEAIGYVNRAADQSDSRAKLIALTKAGNRHIEQLSAATEQVWQQYVDENGRANTEQIFAGLRQLLNQNT